MTALSDVAGIVDRKGGFRVVVTQRFRMRHHVGKGERLFVVPGLKVQEPIPFENIYGIVSQVEEYITSVTSGDNACGGCKQCCITLPIQSATLNKSPHTQCHNCSATGCRIYFYRPEPCKGFQCLWLKTQNTNHAMAPELRPDRCGVIFTGDVLGEPGSVFQVHPTADDPDAVHRDPVRGFIEKEQAEGRKAYLVSHYDVALP